MKNACIITFDCETGGLDSEKHPITEIALTSQSDDFKVINNFKTYVKPYANLTITKEAVQASMISMSDIQNGMDYKKVVDICIKFFKETNPSGNRFNRPILVGHNVAFDVAFLTTMFSHAGKNLHEYVQSNNKVIVYVDTLPLSKFVWAKVAKDDSSLNLTSCSKRIGIDLVDAHGAANDVKATISLMQWFVDKLKSNQKKKNQEETSASNNKPNRHFKFSLSEKR